MLESGFGFKALSHVLHLLPVGSLPLPVPPLLPPPQLDPSLPPPILPPCWISLPPPHRLHRPELTQTPPLI